MLGAITEDVHLSAVTTWMLCLRDPNNSSRTRVAVDHYIGAAFFFVTSFFGQQKKVLYMDVLMLRSHGREGAANRHQAK